MWTAVDHFRQGILAWVVEEHSAESFQPLWDIVYLWKCYFHVTDGWKVYASFVEPGDHIISKTGVAKSGDDFTKFSRIYQWFQTLIDPALMQGQLRRAKHDSLALVSISTGKTLPSVKSGPRA